MRNIKNVPVSDDTLIKFFTSFLKIPEYEFSLDEWDVEVNPIYWQASKKNELKNPFYTTESSMVLNYSPLGKTVTVAISAQTTISRPDEKGKPSTKEVFQNIETTRYFLAQSPAIDKPNGITQQIFVNGSSETTYYSKTGNRIDEFSLKKCSECSEQKYIPVDSNYSLEDGLPDTYDKPYTKRKVD